MTPLSLCVRASTLPGVSSLWTPEGEHRVPRQSGADDGGADDGGAGSDDVDLAPQHELSEEEAALAAHLDELRGQLLSAPAEVVVANHAYGLFELAALHLSEQPPNFDEAKLAVDALGALVEGLAGRLGEPEPSLVDALAQIRLAFVQIQAAGEGDT